MNRRTTLMVAYDILQVAREGSNKTKLVYRCNLNFRIIKKWLSRLMSKGLLEFNALPSKTWTTTPKGLKFISTMDELMMTWNDGLIYIHEVKMEVVVEKMDVIVDGT